MATNNNNEQLKQPLKKGCMRIILLENVRGLGDKDDMIEVRAGYARNYLIPRHIALAVTPSVLRQHEEIKRQRVHKEEKLRQEAAVRAEELAKIKLVLGAKTSTTGKIFGSVTTLQLAEALAAKGVVVDRHDITIEEAVKEIGTYRAKIKLYKELSAQITFQVVSE
ncbi:MAG: 50S ribosomal protein L9 [Bacteroides sp.]